MAQIIIVMLGNLKIICFLLFFIPILLLINKNKIIKMAVNFNVFYVYDLYIFIARKNYISKEK